MVLLSTPHLSMRMLGENFLSKPNQCWNVGVPKLSDSSNQWGLKVWKWRGGFKWWRAWEHPGSKNYKNGWKWLFLKLWTVLMPVNQLGSYFIRSCTFSWATIKPSLKVNTGKKLNFSFKKIIPLVFFILGMSDVKEINRNLFAIFNWMKKLSTKSPAWLMLWILLFFSLG